MNLYFAVSRLSVNVSINALKFFSASLMVTPKLSAYALINSLLFMYFLRKGQLLSPPPYDSIVTYEKNFFKSFCDFLVKFLFFPIFSRFFDFRLRFLHVNAIITVIVI